MRLPAALVALAACVPLAAAQPLGVKRGCPAGLPTGDIVPGPQAAPPCPASAYTVVADLAYGSHPSQRLDLYRPLGAVGPLPTVIWIHGGGWRGGDKSEIEQPRRLLCRGYAVASINYRLSGVALFPAQIEDVKAAIAFLRAHAGAYGLDSGRFAAFGSSAGGHLAALAGTAGASSDTAVRAVVDWYGPVDFARMDEQIRAQGCNPGAAHHGAPASAESQLLGCTVSDPACADEVARANPAGKAHAGPPAFLLLHGDADCTVPPAQAGLLRAALERGGCTIARTVRGAGHGGPPWSTPEVQEATAAFLDAVLAVPAAKPAPHMPPTPVSVNCAAFVLDGDPHAPNGADWTYTSVDDGVEYEMEGVLFVPPGGGPFPGVLISHGKMGTPRRYSAGVGRTMVGWGLAVIAPMYTHAPDADDAGHLPDGSDGELDANVLRAHKALDLLGCVKGVDLTRIVAHGHGMGLFVTGQLWGDYWLTPPRVDAYAWKSAWPNATRPTAAAAIVAPHEIHYHEIDNNWLRLPSDEVVRGIFFGGLKDILVSASSDGGPRRPYLGLSREELSQDPQMLARVRSWYEKLGVLP